MITEELKQHAGVISHTMTPAAIWAEIREIRRRLDLEPEDSEEARHLWQRQTVLEAALRPQEADDAMDVPMGRYEPGTPCPKCGDSSVSVTWTAPLETPEALKLACGHCGYGWRMAPADRREPVAA